MRTQRKAKSDIVCPADDCRGGRSDRQHPLTEGQLSQVAESDRQTIREAGEAGHEGYRCNYCGCVYVRGVHHNRILGWLDNGVLGPGWKPIKVR